MIINTTMARNNLFKLIDEVITTQEPTYITTQKGNVVVLAEEDYKAIQETLYLSPLPGMKEKIIAGMNTPLEDCVEDPDDE